MTAPAPSVMAIGSYTPADAPVGTDPAAGPAGLTLWQWDGHRSLSALGAADLASPSFVCWHPELPMLYAVSELDEGVLTAVRVSGDGIPTTVASRPSGGAQPCWVTTDPTGRALLIANYDVSGAASTMTVVGLDSRGVPTGESVVVAHHGSGPVADRQSGAHVHQVVPTAEGTVLASDLGADRIIEYRIDDGETGVSVTEVGRCVMPTGSGPRHMTLAAGGAVGFVSGELDGTVTTIARSGAGWNAVGQARCTARSDVDASHVAPSQVMLAAGDRWLVVANRGTNTLAVLDVANDLTIVDEQPTGRRPRDFTIVDDLVLVACRDDDEVRVARLDPATGTLTDDGRLTAGGAASPLRAPSCVAIRR